MSNIRTPCPRPSHVPEANTNEPKHISEKSSPKGSPHNPLPTAKCQEYFKICDEPFHTDPASKLMHSSPKCCDRFAHTLSGTSAPWEGPPRTHIGIRTRGLWSQFTPRSQNTQLSHPLHSPTPAANPLSPERNEFHPPWMSFLEMI